MKARDRSLPYPVLSPFRDDVTPSDFAAVANITADPENYYFDVSLTLGNASILQAISTGLACYGVHIESSGNYFRKFFRLKAPQERITIPADLLYGIIEVSFFAVSAAPISNYQVEGAHLDYEGVSFAVKVGDILAVAPTITFDAFKDRDALAKISSIMRIEASEDKEGPFTLDLEGDKIHVYLSKTDYERYGDLKNGAKDAPVLSALIVVPVLVEALYRMRLVEIEDEDNELIKKRWFRLLKKRLEAQGLNYRDLGNTPLVLAQKILVNPLNRALTALQAEDGVPT